MAAAASLTGKRFSPARRLLPGRHHGDRRRRAERPGGTQPDEAAAAQALLAEESAGRGLGPDARDEPETSLRPPPRKQSSGAGAASSGPLPSSAPATEPTAPATEPETPEAPPTEPEAPEPGPIQHVFVVSVASPGYDAAFGAASQMPYLSGELRAQGVLLTNYSLLDTARAAERHRDDRRPAARPPATKSDCPGLRSLRCRTVETLTLADQLAGAQFSWHGYFEGMTDTEGKADNCVHPEPEAADVPTAGGYSRCSTRSSTSTRCSTSATATKTTCRWTGSPRT